MSVVDSNIPANGCYSREGVHPGVHGGENSTATGRVGGAFSGASPPAIRGLSGAFHACRHCTRSRGRHRTSHRFLFARQSTELRVVTGLPEDIRCAECRRGVDEFTAIAGKWGYWSDGVGALEGGVGVVLSERPATGGLSLPASWSAHEIVSRTARICPRISPPGFFGVWMFT